MSNNTIFQNEAYQLKSLFQRKGLNLKISHAHELIAGYFGCNSKKGLIQRIEDHQINLDTKWLPLKPSRNHLNKAIDRLKEFELGDLQTDDIALMISKSLDYSNIYLLDTEGLQYLKSRNLDIEVNEYRELIATYRDDYPEIHYVRTILRRESFLVEEVATTEKILDHLRTYDVDESKYEPYGIMLDEEIFYTDSKNDRELVIRELK